jgi:hypothetical protein
METLHETSTTPASVRYSGPASPQAVTRIPLAAPVKTRTNPGFSRKEEIFAWIMMAAIWGISAIALYLLWAKVTRGV